MRKTARTILATLALVIMFALSSGVALAGWGYEDCPPASAAGVANRSQVATDLVSGPHPSDVSNPNSRYPGNPGNKY